MPKADKENKLSLHIVIAAINISTPVLLTQIDRASAIMRKIDYFLKDLNSMRLVL